MMRYRVRLLAVVSGVLTILGLPVNAQALFPATVKKADGKRLAQQSDQLYKVIDPLTGGYSRNTVVIKSGRSVVAMGTVTKKGIVTKLSEISENAANLRIIDHSGKVSRVVVIAENKDYDLALLENTTTAEGVVLRKNKALHPGSFVIAVGAQNQALGMGVVSVEPRSLRQKDKAFLGIQMDMEVQENGGVRLERVQSETAAARAGLQAGDVIHSINGNVVGGLVELRNTLLVQKVGDTIVLDFQRGNKRTKGLKITLGSRQNIPVVSAERMDAMKAMGGTVNRVSEGFPEVLQSDMVLSYRFCGCPVIDLDGDLIGVVVARSSRIKTYIIETEKLMDAFK